MASGAPNPNDIIFSAADYLAAERLRDKQLELLLESDLDDDETIRKLIEPIEPWGGLQSKRLTLTAHAYSRLVQLRVQLRARTDTEVHVRTMTPQPVAPSPPAGAGDWFDLFKFCIPKVIREPWMGDLREDRQRMRQAGRGRLFVELATACQLLCLVAATLWDSAKETISRSLRVS